MTSAATDRFVVSRTTLEVDGVRVLHFPREDEVCAATLLFAVGDRHETLPTYGTLHALEHVVMSEVRRTAIKINASVDVDHTEFTAEGSPERVGEFLTHVCRSLTNPPVHRLDHEARVLAGLREQQANLALQLDKVQDKIAAGTPAAASATGTSVVQAATVATGPSMTVRLLLTAPAAALAALVLAAILVLLVSRRDKRIRFRDDIADAVGSPVLASVRSHPQRSVAAWTTFWATSQPPP